MTRVWVKHSPADHVPEIVPEISYKKKPTGHKQACHLCGARLYAGDPIVRTISSVSYNGYPCYSVYHPHCFASAVNYKCAGKEALWKIS